MVGKEPEEIKRYLLKKNWEYEWLTKQDVKEIENQEDMYGNQLVYYDQLSTGEMDG